MAFIEDFSTAKNYSKNNQAWDFLRHWLLQTPGENYQEKKKDELSPAIGKNYINKNVSFLPVRVRTQTGLLTFYL